MSDFESYEEALEFLNSSLRGGISKLLEEAKRKGCIAPPYGRPPTPSPFVDESQIDEEALLKEDLNCQKLDMDNFDYEYGFNPLLFLGDYVRRVHPASVAARKRDRIAAVDRLEQRANHARNQLATAIDLKHRADYLRSGIMHGPLSTPITSNSVMIWCRSAVSGTVIVEISKFRAFSSARTNDEVASFSVESSGPDEPVTIVAHDLSYSTRYFVRCHVKELEEPESASQHDSTEDDDASKTCLEDDSVVDVPLIGQTSYALAQFWTLPNVIPESRGVAKGLKSGGEESARSAPVELIAIARQPNLSAQDMIGSIKEANDCTSDAFDPAIGFGAVSIAAKHPILTCIVGDLFDPIPADDNTGNAVREQIYNLFKGNDVSLSAAAGVGSRQYCSRSLATMSSLLFAWNDSQPGSDTGLKAEEVVHKQFSYETRRYEKKLKEKQEKRDKDATGQAIAKSSSKRAIGPPPIFTRPDMSSTFKTVVKYLPVLYAEENVRHLYRSFPLSEHVDVFILDNRNGYLGKEQIRWLKDGLRKSNAPMKIIFTGKSFGVNMVNQSEDVPVLVTSKDIEAGVLGDGASCTDGEDDVEKEDGDDDKDEAPQTNEVGLTTASGGDGGAAGKERVEKKMSSSRKRALEATQEEFDEYGISKSSLQHAIINTFQHMYPHGYTKDAEDGRGEDGDDLFTEQLDTDFAMDSAREIEDEKEGADAMEWGVDNDCDLPVVELAGGILIVSSSSAADSVVKTFAFSDTPLCEKAFCMEVSVGTGFCQPGHVCRELPHGSSQLDKVISLGRKNLFRSTVVPQAAAGEAILENSLGAENIVHSSKPIVSSVTVRPDGTIRVQLREFASGLPLFQVVAKSPPV